MASSGWSYRPVARLIHWVTAAIVLGMIPAGLIMTQKGIPRGLQDTLFIFHKNAGVVILLLTLWRLGFRLTHPPAPLPASIPGWQRRAAAVSHALLYGLLLIMATSGYTRVIAGGFPLESLDAIGFPRLVPRSDALAERAQGVHFVAHYAVIALVALHIAAALQHALIKRDGVFQRMWPTAPGSRIAQR